MLNRIKDKAFGEAIKQSINFKIKDFGKISKLKIDTQNKTIELELVLKGEREPLYVKVGKYEISQEDEKHYLVAEDIDTSREWINVVASNYLENQKFEIPEKAIKILKTLM